MIKMLNLKGWKMNEKDYEELDEMTTEVIDD